MSKRLFIASKISDNLIDNINNWIKQNNKVFPEMRWTQPENLHITLVPPNIIKDEKEGIEKLNKINTNKFDITFSVIELAPKKPYRLLWTRADNNEGLQNLKDQIEDIFAYKETRSDKVHCTLGRLKVKMVEEFRKEINWQEEINTVELIESILQPDGAKYKVIDSVKMK